MSGEGVELPEIGPIDLDVPEDVRAWMIAQSRGRHPSNRPETLGLERVELNDLIPLIEEDLDR